MKHAKLTNCVQNAHKSPMRGKMRERTALMAMVGLVPLAGCITLEAPDEPIVIELNINITQEVIYHLAEDAGNTIDENASIF